MRRLSAAALAILLAVGQAHAQSSYFNGRNYGAQPGRPILLPYTTVQSDGGNDTSGVQAAINVSQGQPFIMAAAAFHVCGLTVNTGQALLGSGVGVTTLEPVTGCTAPLVSSYQFGSLTGSGSSGGPADFEIGNFSIVGPSATGTTGSGVAVYGRQFRVHDLYVTGMGGSGLWTEYTRSGNGTSPYDCHVYRVTVDTVGQTGWYNGCSDVHADDINVRGASQVSTGTYDGIEADTNAAIHGSNFNVWGIGYVDPTHRYALNLAGDGSTIANAHLETGRAADLFVGGNLNNVTGLFAYNLPNEGTPVAVIVQGNFNFISGVTSPQAGNAAIVGVQVGTAAHAAELNTLFLTVNGFTGGLFDFTHDGGFNQIVGTNSQASGTTIVGTPTNDKVIETGTGAKAWILSQ